MAKTFADLDTRVRVAREQLSTLAGWWPTPMGSFLARKLQGLIYDLRHWDVIPIKGLASASFTRVVIRRFSICGAAGLEGGQVGGRADQSRPGQQRPEIGMLR
jgi:hypothetical protein